MADAVVPRYRDSAAVDIFFPHQNPQQGGLAVAVAAHQADLLPRVEGEADTVEENVAAIAFMDIFNTDHNWSAVLRALSFLKRRYSRNTAALPVRPACGYYI